MKTKFKDSGFTLIELLTVIAIIGILAAIIIPTVSSVRTSANKAKTKVQFNQWGSAIALFKQDYGFYPYFATGSAPNADTTYNLNNATAKQLFVEILSGRQVNGTALSAGGALTQNKRRGSYFSFSDAELKTTANTVDHLMDAFGNVEMIVRIDYGYDGLITPSAGDTVRGGGFNGEPFDAPRTIQSSTYPADGVRAGVIIYSAGKGSNNNDIVTSW